MAKYQISYMTLNSPESIDATGYDLRNGWFTFVDYDGTVTQIREAVVDRIDRIDG